MPDLPASLLVNVVDGTRQPLVTNQKLLIRVIDGNQKEQSADFHNGPVDWKQLPIPDATQAQQAVLVAIVDKILAALGTDPNADVSVLEAEISERVATLYGVANSRHKLT
jgi:hypothetical protein